MGWSSSRWFSGTLVVSTPARADTIGPADPISHVVIIYQENHSFDNVLGGLVRGQTGRCNGSTTAHVFERDNDQKGAARAGGRRGATHEPHRRRADQGHGRRQDGQVGRPSAAARRRPMGASSSSSRLRSRTWISLVQGVHGGPTRRSRRIRCPSWGSHLDLVTGGGWTGPPGRPEPVDHRRPGRATAGATTPTSTRSGSSPGGRLVWVPSCVPDPKLEPRHVSLRRGVPRDAGTVGADDDGRPPDQAPDLADLPDDPADARPAVRLGDLPDVRRLRVPGQKTNVINPSQQVIKAAPEGKAPQRHHRHAQRPDQLAAQHVLDGDGRQLDREGRERDHARAASGSQRRSSSPTTTAAASTTTCAAARRRPAPADGDVSPYAKPGYTDSTPATPESMLAFAEHLFALPAISRPTPRATTTPTLLVHCRTRRRPGRQPRGPPAADGDDAHPSGRATLRAEPPTPTHRHLMNGPGSGSRQGCSRGIGAD